MDGRSFLRGESQAIRCEGGECLTLDAVLNKALSDNPKLAMREALRDSGQAITFAELNTKATELAERLARIIELLPQPDGDKIVAVNLFPDIELIVSLLAIFKIGAAYLPLDPTFPADRVSHILRDAQPILLLTAGSILRATAFASVVVGLNMPVFDLENKESSEAYIVFNAETRGNETAPRVRNVLAAVLYTSGSTGVPKGVRLEHATILHRLNWQWRTFPFHSTEVGCFKTALTFVDSIAEIWAPLLIGQPVEVVSKPVIQDAQRFIDLLDQCKITRLVLVPSLLKAMLTLLKSRTRTTDLSLPLTDNGYYPLQHLKTWVCSGEILTGELLLEFYDCFPAGTVISNYYGSTELMGDVTYATFRSREDVLASLIEEKIPIGKPMDNCAIYLLDASKELVDDGEIGELYVAGSHLCSGYVRNREMERFVKNQVDSTPGYDVMFRTGDYGKIINGQLYYFGRADSQVKIRGHRVDLSEINAAIEGSKLVSTCVVLSYKPGEPEQEIVAFVIPIQKGTTVETIKERVKDKLLSYMMPKLVVIDEIPLLVNGKVDRQKLMHIYADQLHKQNGRTNNLKIWEGNEFSREERALLKTVHSIVGSSFGRLVQLSDNFFEIGGNSLNAVNVVTKLKDQGFHIDLTEFLAASQLKELVPELSQRHLITKTHTCHRLSGYIVETLDTSVKEEVIRIVSRCFSEKSELDLLIGVTRQDHEIFMEELWEPLVAAGLSFAIKDNSGNIVAVTLNFDLFDEPVVELKTSRLAYILEFLESIEGPVIAKHFEKRKNLLIHSFMMATAETITPVENVYLIQKMEEEILSLAKRKGFAGVFTTNANELTRQICIDLLDYTVLFECQVNQFVASDGTRPFLHAPDTLDTIVTVKYVS
ncbi:beta-alanyl-bioamine nonribosomal peptide synthetase ebony-like isoform X2 [Daphnia carinata]|uniref:beta-alanyl-bioamine nonribosomal peptide synthetase ebony-like isoform X2 n=1 Tax=Daphnia carinata TaxID=120202 RepID=UPI00257B10DA|nr:beta-alanyl-bioamine nonribosomal peptide synthetase ebony-like isoform X2 [Daphnia carinata]